MRTRNLTKTLNGIVSVVLASAAGASCGGEPTGTAKAAWTASDAGADSMVSPADEATFACDAPLAPYTSNLQPAVAVDHVELRMQQFDPDTVYDHDASVGPTSLESESGTACANASDRDTCLAALEQARVGNGKGWLPAWAADLAAPPHWDPAPVTFLVYTRGDEVGLIQSPEALVSFLGQIDTLEEARLVLRTKSSPLTCETTPFKTGWRRNDDGTWEMLTDGTYCGSLSRLRVKISADGVVTELGREDYSQGGLCGRRTEGLVAAPGGGAEVSVAAWLAEAAHLEAASVIAFRRLERELRQLGAPRRLVTKARRSRADEIRHAREMTALARRFGGEPAPVEVAMEAQRTPFAIAIENAVEGCVRETYGALVAGYQAEKATDPELRSVLQRIARDEARHAALAHEVACWLEPRLDADERAAIARARDAALAELRAGVLRAPATDVVQLAGMPGPRDARALLELLTTEVLTQAA